MRQCSATTKAGEQCRRPAQTGDLFCIVHDPTKAQERRRTARRGGRGKANVEVRAVKQLMKDLTDKVLLGEIENQVVYAVVQLQNMMLKAIETERRIYETDELARELEELKKEFANERR